MVIKPLAHAAAVVKLDEYGWPKTDANGEVIWEGYEELKCYLWVFGALPFMFAGMVLTAGSIMHMLVGDPNVPHQPYDIFGPICLAIGMGYMPYKAWRIMNPNAPFLMHEMLRLMTTPAILFSIFIVTAVAPTLLGADVSLAVLIAFPGLMCMIMALMSFLDALGKLEYERERYVKTGL